MHGCLCVSVFVVRYKSLRRVGHPPGGVLTSVIVNPSKGRAYPGIGSDAHGIKVLFRYSRIRSLVAGITRQRPGFDATQGQVAFTAGKTTATGFCFSILRVMPAGALSSR